MNARNCRQPRKQEEVRYFCVILLYPTGIGRVAAAFVFLLMTMHPPDKAPPMVSFVPPPHIFSTARRVATAAGPVDLNFPLPGETGPAVMVKVCSL